MNDSIVSKLLAARAEFEPFGKNKQAYNYKYADLDAIISATGPALLKHGLSVHTSTQTVSIADKPWLIVRACLSDKFGQKLEADIPMPLENVTKAKVPAQDMGSIITYGRRYAYCALLNLTADEDIDAALDEPQKGKTPAPIAAPKPIEPAKPKRSRENDLAMLRSYITKFGKDHILRTLNIENLDVVSKWNDKTVAECIDYLITSLGKPE